MIRGWTCSTLLFYYKAKCSSSVLSCRLWAPLVCLWAKVKLCVLPCMCVVCEVGCCTLKARFLSVCVTFSLVRSHLVLFCRASSSCLLQSMQQTPPVRLQQLIRSLPFSPPHSHPVCLSLSQSTRFSVVPTSRTTVPVHWCMYACVCNRCTHSCCFLYSFVRYDRVECLGLSVMSFELKLNKRW